MSFRQIAARRRARALAAIGIALTLTLALSGMAAAQDPQAVVRYVGAQGMATVGQNLPPAQRTAQLRDLFSTYFDSGHTAAFALGRYRVLATPQQLQEYYRLYEEYTAASYGSQLAQIGAAPFQVTGSRPYGDQIVVASEITLPNGNQMKVDWYLVKRHGKYKIADVTIGGSSMRVTQRAEFAHWIDANGGRFDALLAVLRQQIR